MLKRTKGRFLLTLLVVTGFAGTVNNTAPTKQERRQAMDLLKGSKADLQKEIKGLSPSQLDFKPSPADLSIREYFFHIAAAEEKSWKYIDSAMKLPSRPEQRTKLQLTDKDILDKISDTSEEIEAAGQLPPPKSEWKDMNDAQAAFKSARMQHLKYIKNTTEDLRNHFIELPFGMVDCYQYFLFIGAHSDRHHDQIRQIISHPHFPKK